MAQRIHAVRHALTLIPLLFALDASATPVNPSFETTIGGSLEGWSFVTSGGFGGGQDSELVTDGVRNGRVFSHCAFGATCPSFSAGAFGSLQQSIDFSGVRALVIDVEMRLGGTSGVGAWDEDFEASILIDSVPIWSSSEAGRLFDLMLDLPKLAGLHLLELRVEALVDIASAEGSNHFNFDNLRMVMTPIPEPTSAALTLFGIGSLGLGRRRRRERS